MTTGTFVSFLTGLSPAALSALWAAHQTKPMLDPPDNLRYACCGEYCGWTAEVDFIGTGGGGRTHTLLRVPDFESSASANSATSALWCQQYKSPGPAVNPFCTGLKHQIVESMGGNVPGGALIVAKLSCHVRKPGGMAC